jgi:predicted transcriptional regulator
LSDNNLKPVDGLIALASSIVAAYVSHNHVALGDVPAVIATVHQSLARLTSGEAIKTEKVADTPNAAQIRRSVQQDRIISFIDGKSYKTLKRHLTVHGLTPVTYRERFGLPVDYPMVAPEYSERRSHLAKVHGLGAASVSAPPKGKRRAS